MKLKASCAMTVHTAGDCPIVAMLRPRSGQAQWIVSDHYELTPWVPTTEYVDSYGNLCQRLVLPAGEMKIHVEVVMEVEEQIAVQPDAPHTPVAELPDDALLYLLQSRYCPSDKMAEKAREIVGDTPPPAVMLVVDTGADAVTVTAPLVCTLPEPPKVMVLLVS